MAADAAKYLHFGFTTLIDLDLKAATRDHFAGPEAPELLGCGRGIRLYEGYGPSLLAAIRYRAFPNWVANPDQSWPEGVDPAGQTPAAAVALARAEGALCIKTYHESGFGGIPDRQRAASS